MFKTSILLLIPWRSFLIVSDDSATAVYGDSCFTSEIISFIVSVVFMGSFFVKSLDPQCIRTQSDFLLILSNMVFDVQTCCATVGSYLHIMSFSQPLFTQPIYDRVSDNYNIFLLYFTWIFSLRFVFLWLRTSWWFVQIFLVGIICSFVFGSLHFLLNSSLSLTRLHCNGCPCLYGS